MTGPTSRAEFFRREAGDYLRQMERLLSEESPAIDSLARLARGLRGAARLAGPASFARAANDLEHLVKLLRQGGIGWHQAAARLRRAVTTFQRLTAAVPSWDEPHDREAAALAVELRELIGQDPSTPDPGQPGSAAARSYVARESAVLAGVLERTASKAAQEGGLTGGQAREIRRAMQALRGLEAVNDFPPLADVLEAVDAAASDLARAAAPPDVGIVLLRDAAAAIGRLARSVAAGEASDPNLPEADRLAEALFRQLTGARAAVPVDRLLLRDAPAVGDAHERNPPADPVELSGLGEALRQSAASLRSAPSPVARRLRAFGVVVLLRTAPGGLGHRPAGPFLTRLLEALETLPELRQSESLAVLLEKAGQLLSASPAPTPDLLAQQLERLSGGLPRPVGATTPGARTSEGARPSGRPDHPVGSTPNQPGRDMAEARMTPFERSLASYSRLLREREPVVPITDLAAAVSAVVPIEDLLATGEVADRVGTVGPTPADLPVVEIRSLLLIQPGPPTPPGPMPPGPIVSVSDLLLPPDPVPIERLLYRGRAALERADAIRAELESALRGRQSDLERLEPMVRELLDLVPLALADRA